MFRDFFRRGKMPAPTPETQRETLVRALAEVNGVISGLDPKPSITFDPATGTISLDLPEQMPDEALALPSPANSDMPVASSQSSTA